MFDFKEDLVEKIMSQSDAVLVAERIQQRLRDEHQQRQVFYETICEDDKAEFVNGEIMYHSPVIKAHNDATGLLFELLAPFARMKKLGWVGIEKVLTKFTRNDYEPDVCFFGIEKSKHFQKKQLLFPVPDLAIEVLSKSSEKNINHDRVTKYGDYERHGVSEYWIIDPEDETIEQYVLEDGKYRLLLKSGEGSIRSVSAEGFVIPIRAVFDEELNLETLRKMLS